MPTPVETTLAHALSTGRLDGHRAAIFHDLDRFDRRLDALQAAFPDDTLHCLAIKANPLPALLARAVERGFGLEAASFEELQLARHAGCPPDRIVYDSPVKTPVEIRDALLGDVHLNADNFRELEHIADLGPRPAQPSTIGLRINPLVGAGDLQATSVSTADSKFGVPIARRDAILQAFEKYPWLHALHVHVGSQGYAVDRLVDGIERIHELADGIDRHLGEDRVHTLDIGGGLPVDYRATDTTDFGRAPSFDDYATALRDQVPALFDDHRTLVTEFGRALQVPCGWAATRVEYVKDLPDGKLAATHLGADFLLRRVYRPEDWYHPIEAFDADGQPKPAAPSDDDAPTWTVGGPLCFSGDILARNLHLPRLEPGDWLVLRNVGGYTLSMWSRYCSRAMPPVIGHRDDGSLETLKEAETPDAVLDFWS